jgi:hypothetical protein
LAHLEACSFNDPVHIYISDPVHTDNRENYNTETIECKDVYTYTGFPKGRDFVEVYVSAIATPGHFWVQVIGAMALELDKLSDTMTRFYNSEGQVRSFFFYHVNL